MNPENTEYADLTSLWHNVQSTFYFEDIPRPIRIDNTSEDPKLHVPWIIRKRHYRQQELIRVAKPYKRQDEAYPSIDDLAKKDWLDRMSSMDRARAVSLNKQDVEERELEKDIVRRWPSIKELIRAIITSDYHRLRSSTAVVDKETLGPNPSLERLRRPPFLINKNAEKLEEIKMLHQLPRRFGPTKHF